MKTIFSQNNRAMKEIKGRDILYVVLPNVKHNWITNMLDSLMKTVYHVDPLGRRIKLIVYQIMAIFMSQFTLPIGLILALVSRGNIMFLLFSVLGTLQPLIIFNI